jgi:hypothetical protein
MIIFEILSFIFKQVFSSLFLLIYHHNLTIFISDNKTLTVEPCRKEANSQVKRSGSRLGIQGVISLNMKQWKVS